MSVRWPMPMPAWLDRAFRYRGMREIPGKQHHPTILKWLGNLKAWWSEDETPWCGTFVAEMLRQVGLPVPKHWYRAGAYAEYGTFVSKAAIPFGAICVKSRKGGNHVFFAVAQTRDGNTVFGLGGNQSNSVNITRFKLEEIDHVRWPPSGGQRLSLPFATHEEIGAANRGSEA